MGELGWTLERWKDSTFTEVNYAISGYYRNWERFAGMPMREICYVQIAGNPNIKNHLKPKKSTDYMSFSIDKKRVSELMSKEEYQRLIERRSKITWQSKN